MSFNKIEYESFIFAIYKNIYWSLYICTPGKNYHKITLIRVSYHKINHDNRTIIKCFRIDIKTDMENLSMENKNLLQAEISDLKMV